MQNVPTTSRKSYKAVDTFVEEADSKLQCMTLEENVKKFVEAVPLGRLTDPTDVASAACHLASDEASFITGINMLIDGGKGQLSSAVKSLKLLGLYGKITIVGIAKRLEEIFFPEDPIPLYLDKKSETLKILQRVRDEAHRFGVKHHRTRRTNNTIKSNNNELDDLWELLGIKKPNSIPYYA